MFIALTELGAMDPFRNIANRYIAKRFGFTSKTAGDLLLILYLQPVFLTPVFGIITDKIGKRLVMTMFSIILQIVAHSIFAFISCGSLQSPKWVSTSIGLVILGIFYSMFRVVLFSCIPLVVEKNILGMAYGVQAAVYNGGMVILPILVGKI